MVKVIVASSACSMRRGSSSYCLCIFSSSRLSMRLNRVGALPSFSQRSHTRRSPCLGARSAPRCEASVIRPQESEPGPAGSHETALKKFLSVSELALDREMAATYILGPFRLDAETDTLFRGGEPVSLGHRAVALLRVLVEQRGTPVSKDALMEAGWAGLTVEESNLAVQIAALRRVFGEESGGENWIETLLRRGYRFVGPASIRDQGAVTAASQAANFPMAAGSSNPTLPDRPSLAVLPFQNISADPEQEYFADGMADEIITALSRFPALFVIARNSSFTYKGRAVDVKQVARELGVRYVLEGSVRKAGNRVRFTAAHRCDNRRPHLGGPLRWCP